MKRVHPKDRATMEDWTKAMASLYADLGMKFPAKPTRKVRRAARKRIQEGAR